jgi:hypothetical protein
MAIHSISDLRKALANASLCTYGKSVNDIPYDQWARLVIELREAYLFAHQCKKRVSSDQHNAVIQTEERRSSTSIMYSKKSSKGFPAVAQPASVPGETSASVPGETSASVPGETVPGEMLDIPED